jgi:hypothetical protein
MAHCLWNNSEDFHRYHLANWGHVAMEKDFGGLGVPSLRDLNICLLGSWVRRHAQDKGKIWKMLIDFKYNTSNPNIFTCKNSGVSNFWSGVLWAAANVARMGYRWNVGNGVNVRFWEDVWLGTSNLAIQYWELYYIVNEQNKSIAELWDGCNLRCTFRRCVDIRLYNMWEELLSIASTICLTDKEDEMVWQFHSSGIYSSHSLYRVVNFRGVMPVFMPVVWKLHVSPRIHFFLWLVSKNKLLTRDNLGKRRKVDDPSCLFCSEIEIVHHLLFDCVVAKRAWEVVSSILGTSMDSDYEFVARLWLCNKRYGVTNIISSALCWSIWKLRNGQCFQELPCTGMRSLWQRMVPLLRCWKVLVPLRMAIDFENACSALEKMAWSPEPIGDVPDRAPDEDVPRDGTFQFKPP